MFSQEQMGKRSYDIRPRIIKTHLQNYLVNKQNILASTTTAQRALRLPIGINLSKRKMLIFYLFLLATLHECNFLAILGCP